VKFGMKFIDRSSSKETFRSCTCFSIFKDATTRNERKILNNVTRVKNH